MESVESLLTVTDCDRVLACPLLHSRKLVKEGAARKFNTEPWSSHLDIPPRIMSTMWRKTLLQSESCRCMSLLLSQARNGVDRLSGQQSPSPTPARGKKTGLLSSEKTKWCWNSSDTFKANTWTYLDSELQADSFLTVQFSLSQLVLQAKGNKPSTSLRRRLRGLWKL